MRLLTLLQQPWPILFLHFLLAQHKLNLARRVMRLAVLDIDLTPEL